MNAIVMIDSKRGIARDGCQPLTIPKDRRRFKELTANGYVIMGRKTAESIGRPLSDCRNIIITRDPFVFRMMYPKFNVPFAHAMTYNKFKDDSFSYYSDKEKWIIGGEKIYELFLSDCEKVYTTELKQNLKCDQFFPKLGFLTWKVEEETPYMTYLDEDGHSYEYRFVTYVRRHLHV